MKRLDVLIVDDSAFVRRAVERMLAEMPEVRVVGAAADGREAVLLAAELRPDLVLLDVNMPVMDGLEALSAIMESTPTAVVLLSSVASAGAAETLEALERGAVDFIDKSIAGRDMDIYSLAPLLHEKIRAIASDESAARRPAPGHAAVDEDAASVDRHHGHCPFDLVIIGASTGGPRALSRLLPSLPGDLGAPVVVAQHMPEGFTGPLSERLAPRCALEIREGADGDRLRPGLVLIAPGGRAARIERHEGSLRLRVSVGRDDAVYRPSVDALLDSAREAVGSRVAGVVLTGMGDDGAAALRRLREAGGRTIAESEETAVIYGMPRVAAAAAEVVLPLDRIGRTLARWCRGQPAAGEA